MKILKQHTGKIAFLLIFFSMVFAWFLLFNLNFTSDGERYYSYIRSFFFDGDINFYNEYTFFTFLYTPNKTKFLVKTKTSYLWNPFSIGPSVLWLPFFTAGHLAAWILHVIGFPVLLNGVTLPYTFATALGTLFYAILGLLVCYSILRLQTNSLNSLFAVFVVMWSSPAPAYIFREPAYSHTMSFVFVSIFIYSWLKYRKVKFNNYDSNVIAYLMWLFLLGGIATLVRWQNCILLIIPSIEILYRQQKSNDNKSFQDNFFNILVSLTIIIGSFFIVVLPQFIAWKILFGSFFTVPQGENFMHWKNPALLQVLFSPLNGLFIWHPLLLIGLIGLFWLWKKDKLLTLLGFFFFISQWYINGSVDDWFAGAAFGNRRFINCLPFFMLGIAIILERIRKREIRYFFIGILSIFPLWNILLLSRVYKGDLLGLKSLIGNNFFNNWHLWSSYIKSFFIQNYLFSLISSQDVWQDEKWRILFIVLILLVFIIFYFVLKFLFSYYFMKSYSTSPLPAIPRIPLVLPIAGLLFFIVINLLLIQSDLKAKITYPVHLGKDAFGKVEGLKLRHPEKYMGSLSPIHIPPGKSITIPVEPPVTNNSFLIIATLSGKDTPNKETTTAAQLELYAFNQKIDSFALIYPTMIARMDKDEFSGWNKNSPTVSSSWFFPGKQKLPHHWYRKIFHLPEEIMVTRIEIRNTTKKMTLHVTGISFYNNYK